MALINLPILPIIDPLTHPAKNLLAKCSASLVTWALVIESSMLYQNLKLPATYSYNDTDKMLCIRWINPANKKKAFLFISQGVMPIYTLRADGMSKKYADSTPQNSVYIADLVATLS